MVANAVYVDASAIVKLILPEPETEPLRAYLAGESAMISSRIGAVEVRRVTARQARPGDDEHVGAILDGLLLVELDRTVADAAGSVLPVALRSLDAIHLATALAIGAELDAFVTYDVHLADAARAAGLDVISPRDDD